MSVRRSQRSYRFVHLHLGYCEQPQNLPRRPFTSRIVEWHRSQMTSGKVGRPDSKGRGANDAVSSRERVMLFVSV